MRLKALLLVSLLILLPTAMLFAQTQTESAPTPNNDYGIEPEKSYQGSVVLEIIQAAESEIDNAVDEAYAEGYKAGLLASAPDTAFYKSMSESLQREVARLKGDSIRNGFLFGIGGLVVGMLSVSLYNLVQQ